jgi:hypothetical protein
MRRSLMNTMNLADLPPISAIWTGQVDAPCPMYSPNSPHSCTTSTGLDRVSLEHTRAMSAMPWSSDPRC